MILLIFIGALTAYGIMFTIQNIEFKNIKTQPVNEKLSGIAYNRKKCSNRFELALFDSLVQMGYYPLCQIKEGRYRLDFVLIENGKRIVVEADGDIFHNDKHDRKRDNYLKKMGYHDVIRVKYSQWKENRMECVKKLEMKLYTLQHLPSSHPSFDLQFDSN